MPVRKSVLPPVPRQKDISVAPQILPAEDRRNYSALWKTYYRQNSSVRLGLPELQLRAKMHVTLKKTGTYPSGTCLFLHKPWTDKLTASRRFDRIAVERCSWW